MTPEQREELARQFERRVANLTYELQDIQGMFLALAPDGWTCYDPCVMMNDALELCRRDVKTAWDRASRVRDYLKG
jgi:hypothetical protein